MWRSTDVVPCWIWEGQEGKKTEVQIFAHAAEAELFVNGESQGRKPLEGYKAAFKVTYRPGRLETIVYDENGRECGRSEMKTADEKSVLSVKAENV